jgi:hypothetical protein
VIEHHIVMPERSWIGAVHLRFVGGINSTESLRPGFCRGH